jgi:hypothetical protein
LIAGLERALPAETWSETLPFDVLCLTTDVLLYGSPKEWEAFELDPEGQRVAAYFERLARQNADRR